MNWTDLNFRRWAAGAVLFWLIYAGLLFLPDFGYDLPIFRNKPTVYKIILLLNAGVSSFASIATIHSYLIGGTDSTTIGQGGSGEQAGGGGGVEGAGGGGGNGGRGGDYVRIEGDVVLGSKNALSQAESAVGSVTDQVDQANSNYIDEIEESVGRIVRESIESEYSEPMIKQEGAEKSDEREREIPPHMSEWNIGVSAGVHEDIQDLSSNDQEMILQKIKSLQTHPLKRSKKITGGEGYILRAGEWRIVFEPLPDEGVIRILTIAKRSNISDEYGGLSKSPSKAE